MIYNICYWWLFLSQGKWWTKYLVQPQIQRPKPCLLMFVSLVALDGFHLLLSTQLTASLTLECSGGSMFHPLSHIYEKTPFCCIETIAKNPLNLSMCCCFWSTVNKHITHFDHSFLIDKCSCKMVNTLPSDISNSSAITHNFNLQSEFFGVFQDNCPIWATWTFSIIYICTTACKDRIPPLNCYFWGNRVKTILIKPLLCLNSIFFPHQKTMLCQHTKFRIFHCFENLQLSLHLYNCNL